jgi:hypothetical protein
VGTYKLSGVVEARAAQATAKATNRSAKAAAKALERAALDAAAKQHAQATAAAGKGHSSGAQAAALAAAAAAHAAAKEHTAVSSGRRRSVNAMQRIFRLGATTNFSKKKPPFSSSSSLFFTSTGVALDDHSSHAVLSCHGVPMFMCLNSILPSTLAGDVDGAWERGAVAFETPPPKVLTAHLLNWSSLIEVSKAAYSLPDDYERETLWLGDPQASEALNDAVSTALYAAAFEQPLPEV